MKLAFSTNAFTRFPLLESLRAIKSIGYSGVEILADVPHAYPDSLDASAISAIAREIERLDLAVSNINSNTAFGYWRDAPPEAYFEPSLISPLAQHREDRTRLILKSLDLAKAVGAGNIAITSGRMLGGMPPDKAARQFAESLRPILDRAEQLAINVGIECEPGLFVEYAVELREWIDRLDCPRLGSNLDVGHSQVLGESIPQAIRLLNDRIWNLHIEDIPGRKHYHLIPGQGSLDWSALKTALVSIDYRRFLTVELYTYPHDPHNAAEQSLSFLRNYFPV
ncbi:MAG: sugar phosphate isomerase/epimerase [Planctomycetota bacterium]|nr:sugar phosphate isomerase/epimerase [Planctomycetota bacterium]